jgi:hypothetical protein
MTNAVWLGARIAVVAGALIASGPAAEARGALAVGACGAWGGSWSYGSDRAARNRALDECRGRNCKVVTSFRQLCAAFATDSNSECENAGDRDCKVRGQFCDGD